MAHLSAYLLPTTYKFNLFKEKICAKINRFADRVGLESAFSEATDKTHRFIKIQRSLAM